MERLFNNSILIIFFGCVLHSCVKTDDFTLPDQKEVELKEFENITSIGAVKGHFNFETEEIFTFSQTNFYMEGYVISSDEGGNFYKKLILQDKSENPSAGIQLLVDDPSLFETYNFGRKVYIKLDGLSLWFSNGVLQLGFQNRGDVVGIPPSLVENHVIRTNQTAEIIPFEIDVSQIKEHHKNLFIRLTQVQFDHNLIRDEHRYSLASEETDRFDGERQLESCINGSTIALSTSTYSNFRTLLLPKSSGSIEGVLSRNFYNDHYILILNSPKGLKFDDASRCDPNFLECTPQQSSGANVLFEENFVGISNENMLDAKGWTNINVNGGSKRFEDGIFNSNRFIKISAYNVTENPFEVWLVTPVVDMNNRTGEKLTFEVRSSYDNGTILKVYVTDNFTGNPLTTTWIPLDAKIPLGPSRQFGTSFQKSELNLSCLNGMVNIGFRYHGYSPDRTTTYDIDNIRVISN